MAELGTRFTIERVKIGHSLPKAARACALLGDLPESRGVGGPARRRSGRSRHDRRLRARAQSDGRRPSRPVERASAIAIDRLASGPLNGGPSEEAEVPRLRRGGMPPQGPIDSGQTKPLHSLRRSGSDLRPRRSGPSGRAGVGSRSVTETGDSGWTEISGTGHGRRGT